MSNMVQTVDRAIEKYINHLHNGGERESLTIPAGWYQPDALHASAIGLCPLKNAYKRHEIEPDFPELIMPRGLSWLLLLGQRSAEIIQEALVHSFGDQVLIEPSVKTDDYVGRLDGLTNYHVIEIKQTAGRFSEHYAWQCLAYMQAASKYNAIVILLSRGAYEWQVFEIEEEGIGYVVYDSDGMAVNQKWNDSYYLNTATLQEKIMQHQEYYEQVGTFSNGNTLFPNLFPHELPFDTALDHWNCLRRFGPKARRYKRGSRDGQYGPGDVKPQGATPRCPWFATCWGCEKVQISLDKDDNEIIEAVGHNDG